MTLTDAAVAAALCVPFLSCTSPEKTMTDSSGATAPATVVSAEPKPPRSQEIYIDTVTPVNPLVVSGRARTFENTVQLRVRDAGGSIVAAEHVTSTGEMGHHNPYKAQLWIARDPGARVTVEAFEYSAKDGAVRSLTSTTVPYNVERVRLTLDLPVGNDCVETRAF